MNKMKLRKCCGNTHPNDKHADYIENDESSDMNRWENDGGSTAGTLNLVTCTKNFIFAKISLFIKSDILALYKPIYSCDPKIPLQSALLVNI